MTAEELRAAALELFGPERGWQSRMAAALGIDRSSIGRYLTGLLPVTGPIAAAVTCWLEVHRSTGRKP